MYYYSPVLMVEVAPTSCCNQFPIENIILRIILITVSELQKIH